MSVKIGRLIAKGATAEIFGWGSDRVLKLFLPYVPLEWVEREYNVTQLVQQTWLPMPTAVSLIEWDGRPGIIYERIEGVSVSDAVRRNPASLLPCARMMAELHARIHRIQLPEIPPISEVVTMLIGLADTVPEPLKQAALRALERLPGGDTLCHYDFHADNVLLTDSGPVVIDWMGAGRGDPMSDIARTRQLSGLDHVPPFYRGRSRADAMRRLGWRLYLRRYRELQPAPAEAIAAWRLPIVAARIFGYSPGTERPLLTLLERLSLERLSVVRDPGSRASSAPRRMLKGWK